MQQWRPENATMTFDEASLERSKGFVHALQELKNLRPQLYSAAEYCEKSYLHGEQKQMVLDNLKEYAVRALVNAVDHLGTVACKLTDLSEQQSSDISTVEFKISCLNQQILTFQTLTDKEGLRQQQSFATTTTRHKKHYILPSYVNTRVESSSNFQKDNNVSYVRTKAPHSSEGTSAPKTLSWHLASDNNSAPSRDPHTRVEASRAFEATSDSLIHLEEEEEEEPAAPMSLSSHLQVARRRPPLDVGSSTFGVKEPLERSKSLSGSKSFDDSGRREIYHAPPPSSKSILSAFFPRNKAFKPRRVPVS
ncbi:putative protein ABIL1 isoform X2 [Canna indica]|uniref:Uncharacterized protein n=1 Tax=Canna indica TaxID=4628 RepID=A0AAQ3JKE9_9LILI|nr:putative protein ABIL1 isoform X2 [Canna indica]